MSGMIKCRPQNPPEAITCYHLGAKSLQPRALPAERESPRSGKRRSWQKRHDLNDGRKITIGTKTKPMLHQDIAENMLAGCAVSNALP